MIIDYIMEAKSAEGLPLQSAKRILWTSYLKSLFKT